MINKNFKNNTLMFQGTGSDVGKSLLVAGFCRALYLRGISVAPFKPQNMSNNAGVTNDGGEIGRAQMLQAMASHLDPSVHMNPVLLKPQSGTGSQVIIQGKVFGSADSSYFRQIKPQLMSAVIDSFNKLQSKYDFIAVEGAGSPAEINLRDGDIANMGFAMETNSNVVLVVDVDRGGSIASVVGTMAILPDEEKLKIKGFIINKFIGDVSLYQGALDTITKLTGLKCFGVLPWFEDANLLPAEDAVVLDRKYDTKQGDFKICVLRTPCIANFDDLDPLQQTPNIVVEMLEAPNPIPTDCNMVLLVGSKATLSDLQYIKDNKWDADIISHYRRGGIVMGLCAGYQMLGIELHDSDNIESDISSTDGLGLLDVKTVLSGEKKLVNVTATDTITNTEFTGYEMHMGVTTSGATNNHFCELENGLIDGSISDDGLVIGTYIHGIFNDDNFRTAILKHFTNSDVKSYNYNQTIDDTLNKLASHLEQYLNIDVMLEL